MSLTFKQEKWLTRVFGGVLFSFTTVIMFWYFKEGFVALYQDDPFNFVVNTVLGWMNFRLGGAILGSSI